MGIVVLKLLPHVLPAQGGVAEFREVHLGMEVRMAVVPPDADPAHAERAARAAFARIAALEDVLSDWRATSEVRRLEAAPVGAWQPVSEPLAAVLALALDMADATRGAFDPTIGPLTALWREAARTGRAIAPAEREAALARVGHRYVAFDRGARRVRLLRDGMRLDLGAVAKGWIVDEALDVLRGYGACAALVEAGGDLALFGAPPGQAGWRIAVPRADGDTVLVLTAGAVSTSGPDAQSIPAADAGVEGHVIDPVTGHGARRAVRITVVGPRAAITDALATALTLVPTAEGRALAARHGAVAIAP